jgi:hypothetical protein
MTFDPLESVSDQKPKIEKANVMQLAANTFSLAHLKYLDGDMGNPQSAVQR